MKNQFIIPLVQIWFSFNILCPSEGYSQKILVDAEIGKLELEAISDTFLVPYGIAFLPSGTMIVSDRTKGKLYNLDPKTKKRTLIKNIPVVQGDGFGGMMAVEIDPDFSKNKFIYFNYTILQNGKYKMVLDRAQLVDQSLLNRKRLFITNHGQKTEGHVGSSIALRDGYVFFSTGEFYDQKDSAQSLTSHLGKIIRLYTDGRIPKDNPFVSMPEAKHEIWSYGHRNPQGLAFHPNTHLLYEHEHGPKGGDEINIITKGKNYGWPIICHGVDYDNKPIGEGIKEKQGMEQPLYFYDPSIAPCGISFYTGIVFTNWKNNLFLGAMAKKHLNRLVIENGKVIHEERLFLDQKWRVRSIKEGPDGFLYMGIDKGPIFRIKPASN